MQPAASCGSPVPADVGRPVWTDNIYLWDLVEEGLIVIYLLWLTLKAPHCWQLVIVILRKMSRGGIGNSQLVCQALQPWCSTVRAIVVLPHNQGISSITSLMEESY